MKILLSTCRGVEILRGVFDIYIAHKKYNNYIES